MSGGGLRHERIMASAGSGKTYRLASRAVGLVLRGAEPSTILATTFTRAAAGEIRDRVLERLARAALDDAARRQLADATGVSPLPAPRVLEALRRTADALPRLQMRTIDSFLGGIARAFAPELGLPLDAEMLDEAGEAAVRAAAVRAVLDGAVDDEILELLRRLAVGRANAAVVRFIDETVCDLQSAALDAPPEAWRCIPEVPTLDEAALTDAVGRIEHAIQAALDAGVTDQMDEALRREREHVRRHAWEELLRGGVAKNVMLGKPKYRHTVLDSDLVDAYRPVVEHARAMIIRDRRLQTEATRELLRRHAQARERLLRERGALGFDDVTRAVVDAVSGAAFDTVLFRLDARIRHLLLDEFQDTSALQWRAIAPLAQEIVADETSGRTLFVVGDVKQSIYGWRNAAPEILADLPALLFPQGGGEGAIHDELLPQSRRSAPPIIDAVNAVFGSLAPGGNPGVLDAARAAAAFHDAFVPHTTVHADAPGFVDLAIVPAGEKPTKAEKRAALVEAAVETTAALHAACPNASIGLLVRTNGMADWLVQRLGPAGRGLPVSGEGGGVVLEDPAATALVDLVRLAAHPDDTIAAFHVAAGPLGAVVGLADAADDAARHAVAARVRRAAADEGLAPALARYAAAVAAACTTGNRERVEALVEIAERFDREQPARLDAFEALAETLAVRQVRPAPIRAMTVHRAKGLEFDIVVLPELDGELAGRMPKILAERASAGGPVVRIARSLSKELLATIGGELAAMHERDADRRRRESLCLLYVAMTRARHGLVMLVGPPPKKGGAARASSVLLGALADGAGADLAEGARAGRPIAVHASGDRDAALARLAGRPAAPAPDAAAPVLRLGPPSGARPAAIGAAPPSALGHGRRTLADELGRAGERARTLGTLVHRLFETIAWLDDAGPDDAALERAARETAPRAEPDVHAEALAIFRAALAAPEIRSVLQPPADRARAVVRREQPFARLVDGEVQRGVIDRLVVELDAAGRPARAEVIDFKTDRVAEPDLAASAEGYAAQLGAYRAVVAGWLGLPLERVTAALAFVRVGRIIAPA